MSGKRRPMDVNLAVVGDGHGKHWTKEEIEQRLSSEVKVKKPKAISPPAWLPKNGKSLFRKYAKMLLEFPSEIVSNLDAGTLARYCDCELSYSAASRHKSVWMETADRHLRELSDAAAIASPKQIKSCAQAYEEAQAQLDFWTGQMVKFEKIARGCATELGMTISSRCRLVIPKTAAAEVEKNPLEQLLAAKGRNAASS